MAGLSDATQDDVDHFPAEPPDAPFAPPTAAGAAGFGGI